MGFSSCIARMSTPPPFPNDHLSKTKNRLSLIGLVVLVGLVVFAAIFFATYDSQHSLTSLTVVQDAVKIDHILVAFSQYYKDCTLTPSIKSNPPVPEATIRLAPVDGYDIAELISTEKATGQPITDYSKYLIEIMITTHNADRSCSQYNAVNVQFVLIFGPISPDTMHAGPLSWWISFGMNTFVVMDVQSIRTTYGNGSTSTSFTSSTRYSSPLVTGTEKAFCSMAFSSLIQVIKYETPFGLFKRIVVDIGSSFTVASLIAALFVYITIRILHKEPAAWINHEMREAVLYTVDAQSKSAQPSHTLSSQDSSLPVM